MSSRSPSDIAKRRAVVGEKIAKALCVADDDRGVGIDKRDSLIDKPGTTTLSMERIGDRWQAQSTVSLRSPSVGASEQPP